MPAAGWIRYVYLAHLSQPKSIRQLYRLVKRRRVCRIVEIGISNVVRTVAMIEVAQRFAGRQKVAYSGIDWFDTRSSQLAPLSLKDAYRLLRPTEANLRLVPGEPGRSLKAAANAHQNTDLILIAHSVVDAELTAAWFYMPRMLHERSLILREQPNPHGEPEFMPLTIAQVNEHAARGGRLAA